MPTLQTGSTQTKFRQNLPVQSPNFGTAFRELLKTSVFRSFPILWRKSHLRNSLYYKELAIFSEEPLETQPGFSEVPFNV
jgi:hypothetical protein